MPRKTARRARPAFGTREEDPSAILFYEQYTGPEAIEVHCASEHYKKYALSGVMTRAVSQRFEHLSPVV